MYKPRRNGLAIFRAVLRQHTLQKVGLLANHSVIALFGRSFQNCRRFFTVFDKLILQRPKVFGPKEGDDVFQINMIQMRHFRSSFQWLEFRDCIDLRSLEHKSKLNISPFSQTTPLSSDLNCHRIHTYLLASALFLRPLLLAPPQRRMALTRSRI